MKSNPRPELSFVIPAFNRVHMLPEAVMSCLSQTLKNIEVVIVDDGSRDTTPQYAAHLHSGSNSHRIQYVRLPRNRGRSAARNAGNAAARADIIAVLDSDDLAGPDRAKITLRTLRRNPKAAMFYGGFVLGDFWGNRQDGAREPGPFDLERVKESGMTYILHSTMAYPKKIAEKYPYTDGPWSKLGSDDYKFIVDMALGGEQFCFTQEKVSMYRVIEDSISAGNRDEDAVAKLKAKFWKGIQ